MSHDAPSVRLLLDATLQEVLADHGHVGFMQELSQGFDLIDAALLPHLESGAAEIEISPADVTLDDETSALVVRALGQLPRGFAELSGRTADGELLRGASIWQAARAAVGADRRAAAAAAKTTVFYSFNLDILRQAAPAARPPVPTPT